MHRVSMCAGDRVTEPAVQRVGHDRLCCWSHLTLWGAKSLSSTGSGVGTHALRGLPGEHPDGFIVVGCREGIEHRQTV